MNFMISDPALIQKSDIPEIGEDIPGSAVGHHNNLGQIRLEEWALKY
jgi:hypothetical protein